MKQNLRTTHYADGTEIALGNTSSDFNSPFRYAPGSESAEVLNAYGYLYNWAAAMHGGTSSSANPSGVQGVCPDGWHVPSYAEWMQLNDYCGTCQAMQNGPNSPTLSLPTMRMSVAAILHTLPKHWPPKRCGEIGAHVPSIA